MSRILVAGDDQDQLEFRKCRGPFGCNFREPC
jgi:hypothetical protein